MLVRPIALLVLLAAPQDELLRPGQATKGEIDSESPAVESPGLAERHPEGNVRGAEYALEVGAGTWTIELRAQTFDPYLVVRDAAGEVVAEDDDGLVRDDARVLLEVPEGGGTYTVWACAPKLHIGPFELRVVEGDAPLPDPSTRVEDPRAFVEEEWEKHGLGDREGVKHIFYRASEHYSRKRDLTALRVLEYAVLTLDPDEPDHHFAEARFRQLLLLVLVRLGRRAEAIECGLRAAELMEVEPPEPGHATLHYNLAYYMWPLSRFEEGLAVIERCLEYQRSVTDPESIEARIARTLAKSYQRVNGRWDEALADLPEPIVLRPDEPLEGRIELNDPLYQITGVLDHDYSSGRTRCRSIPFRVERSGDYTLEMRSLAFDAYLVLRDARGTLLAEDDDGRGLRDARIVVPLVAGETYLLEPTALHDGFREWRVDLIEGRPEDLDGWTRRERALEEIDECLALADDWPEERDRRGLVNVLFHTVTLQGALGRSDDVVETRRRELELLGELYGPDSDAVLFSRVRYGSALRTAGRVLEAIPILEEARDELERRRGSEGAPPGLLRDLAWCRAGRGDFERAETLFREHRRRIERERGRESSEYVLTLGNRADLLLKMGRADEAAELRSTVVDWYEESGARDELGARWILANALGSLAVARLWAGDLEDARLALEDSIGLRELDGGERSSQVAYARSELAWILHRQGDVARALEQWTLAGEIYAEHRIESTSHFNVGAEILAAAGESGRAFELATRAVEGSSRSLARRLASLPEPLRLREAERDRWTRAVLLGTARRVDGSERRTYELLAPRKALVGRGLVESRAGAQAALDPETRATIAELQNVQSELAQAFHEGDDRLAVRLRARRVELEDELARSEAGTGTFREVRVDELATALPEGAVLVDLVLSPELEPVRAEGGRVVAGSWWEEERGTAWIVRAGEDGVARVDLGPASALHAAAFDPGGALVAARGIGSAEPARPGGIGPEALRRLLWDPIAPHVGDAPLVFVSTYGFLGSVPFEVLQEEDGTFLIERHAFVYVSDAAALLEAGSEPDVLEPSLLLVGDVDYDRRAGAGSAGGAEVRSLSRLAALGPDALRGPSAAAWSPLPFTAREVERIDDLFGDREATERLVGSAATEEALKRALPGHAYVHVATHGFFHGGDDAAPDAGRALALPGEDAGVAGLLPGLLSGLVLAGANAEPEEGRDDGLLTAEELTWLDLSRCELVALSACETGLGAARGGEGMIGLRRAFHQAGARTVVASLWSVEDEATARLMDAFYRYLWVEGLPRVEALRSAQLDLLRANRAEHGEPRPWTWGAFVLSGEWR